MVIRQTVGEAQGADLDALEALAKAATAGPWGTREAVIGGPDTIGDIAITAEALPSGSGYLPIIGEVIAERHKGYPDNAQARADAAYIVALVNAAPALFAELRAARTGLTVEKLAETIVETRFGWPVPSLGNPRPPSPIEGARIQAEAILELLVAAADGSAS